MTPVFKQRFWAWFSPVEAGIALGTFLVCAGCYTFNSDDYGLFMHNMAAGQFTDFSLIDWYFLVFVGIDEIYKTLYDLFPKYAWIPIGLTLSMLWALYMSLLGIRQIVFAGRRPDFLLRILQVAFALSFFENFIYVSNTRVGLMLCGIALFNLAFMPQPTRGRILGNGLIFLLGLLYRPESGTGMLLLVSAGHLAYKGHIVEFLRRLWFPIAVFVVFITSISVYVWHSNEFVVKIEPEIEYEVMVGNVVPISEMKTTQDSIKYQVATRGMWFDPQVVDTDFLRSILTRQNSLSRSQLQRGFVELSQCLEHFPFFEIILPVLLLFGFLLHGRNRGIRLVLFLLFSFGMFYYLGYRHLIAERHLLPSLQIAFIITLYYVFSVSVNKTGAGRIFILLIACSVGLYYNFIQLNYKNAERASMMNCSERIMDDFEQRQQGRIVVITNPAFHLLDHRMGIYNENYTKNRYIIYDLFNYSLVERNMDYLSRLCGCDARRPPDFFKWLSDNDALYATDEARFELMSKYMGTIYGQDLRFEEDSANIRKDCEAEYDIGFVELRKVSVKLD